MYIVPNSEIYILKDVPIEPNYNHTLYFSSIEEQTAYFTTGNKVLFHLTNYSRIKITENEIKVELPVDRLYNANYIAFRNTAFGSKFFYAFVTNVEYINNVTTRLTYTLDVVQTWFFEHSLGQCFVVREHSATDIPGDNLLPEDLELGEYLYEEYNLSPEKNMFSEWAIFIGSTVDTETPDTDVEGQMYQGLYSGVKWFPFLTPEEANEYIGALTDTQKSSGIIGVVMLPKRCAEISDTQYIAAIEHGVPVNYYPNGYTPRNKKLCTAPYTQLLVTDYQGHAAQYCYEYFSHFTDNEAKFLVEAPISAVPQFICTPMYYKGLSLGPTNRVAYHESLIIGDIPQCSYAIDSYRAWIAMASTKVGLATELMGGVGNIVGGAVDAFVGTNLAEQGGIIGGMKDVANTLAKWKDATMMPAQAKSIGGGSGIFQTGEYGFHYLYTYIRPEYAQIIDDFFTMYGYKANRVKIPIVRNAPAYMRPYWNYIKVLNCKIDGSVPVEYERILHDIYERGITFWSTPWDVGNYTYDNSPRGG